MSLKRLFAKAVLVNATIIFLLNKFLRPLFYRVIYQDGTILEIGINPKSLVVGIAWLLICYGVSNYVSLNYFLRRSLKRAELWEFSIISILLWSVINAGYEFLMFGVSFFARGVTTFFVSVIFMALFNLLFCYLVTKFIKPNSNEADKDILDSE